MVVLRFGWESLSGSFEAGMAVLESGIYKDGMRLLGLPFKSWDESICMTDLCSFKAEMRLSGWQF